METSATVMKGVQEDHPRAWERFFSIYGPIVYRYARHSRLQEHDAEEVVAHVMRSLVTLFRGGFVYDPALGKFRYYLKTMTNRAIALVRSKGAAALSLDPVDFRRAAAESPADEVWERTERQERVRACLEKLRESQELNPRDLEAFERFALRGEPASQVALEMGITVNRLYGIKHSVIKRIRAYMKSLSRVLGEI